MSINDSFKKGNTSVLSYFPSKNSYVVGSLFPAPSLPSLLSALCMGEGGEASPIPSLPRRHPWREGGRSEGGEAGGDGGKDDGQITGWANKSLSNTE